MRYEDRTRSKDGGERDPETIQREIRRTQSEMDRTLEALESKLSPRDLMNEILGHLRGSGDSESSIGDTLSSVLRRIKENPIPTALIGIGVLGLVTETGPSSGDMAGAARRGVKRARGAAERTGTGVKELGESGKSEPGVGERARHAASDVASSAKDAAGRLAERASSAGHGLVESVESGYAKVRQRVEDDPLVLGALGVALGAALGASAPRTRVEDELMGEKRDELVAGAKEVGKHVAAEAKHTAGEVADAARGDQGRSEEKSSAGEPGRPTAETARPPGRSLGESAGSIPQRGPGLGRRDH